MPNPLSRFWSYLVSPYPFTDEQRRSAGIFSWWYNLPGLVVRLVTAFTVLLWAYLVVRAGYDWWCFDLNDPNL